MSTSNPIDALRTDTTTDAVSLLLSGVELLAAGAAESTRVFAFWLATFLPLTYLPLVAMDLVGDYVVAFVSLLVLHAVAILVGHGYGSAD